jgi:hypothetical protein
VGILKIEAGACVIFISSLPAFPQVGGLTLEIRVGEVFTFRADLGKRGLSEGLTTG